MSTALSHTAVLIASERKRTIALHAVTGADDTSLTMGARAHVSAVPPGALGGAARKEPAGGGGTSDADPSLFEGLRRGDAAAGAALVRKYHKRVERLVAGALGVDSELADVVQDVFLSITKNIHQVKDPAALPSWVASLAVFTARGYIRKRRRWRWIRFQAPEDVPEAPRAGHDHEGTATLRAVYAAIDTLPADDRLAFTLRYVSELELTEVAAACRVSLATIKRRLTRAEARFQHAARTSPVLRQRLENGGRFEADAGKGEQVP